MTPARTPGADWHDDRYYTLRMRDENGNLRETSGLSAEQVMEMRNGQQVALRTWRSL